MKYFALAYPFPGSYTIFALLFFLLSLLWISKRVHRNTKKAPPEAAGAWPLLGHLPVLGSQKPAHMTLGNMADKYGPVFTIKLGVHRALIVSSWEIARECFTTNDKAFANRPKYLAAELMGYNLAMFGFSPYWRQVRKIATLELLSNHRLEMLKNVRESEVRASIDEIYELWKKKKEESNSGKVLVEMRRWFGDTTLNVILRMVVGKRFAGATTQAEKEESERCSKAIREFFKLGGEFVISDALPFLRRWDLGGQQKAMKETAKELDGVLEIWLEQHKQKKISGEVAGENDFMDMMLSVLDDDNAEEQSPSSYGVDTINKATCLALILGGTDTTSVALTWALSLLLNNRQVLKKAQDELEHQVGRERACEESDIKNLVYLQAIIKETLRLYPSAPLSVPHESIQDCTVGGYHIPAGTRLLVNLAKLHRDSRVWTNPNQFQPERFLTSTCKDFDVRGQNFEFIPFGTGRRVCPGISFALQVMHLLLANLLHAFEITTPLDEPVDMGETSGITNMKATPLEVVLGPRIFAW
ncbi:LOW QUALITY PROTEIN: cytochrome P450 CYP82D47 [Ziziphus jujuba]|uniref:LOW QUALITY PROTEIN: cytochrome P450 CYP82D47 n=1 Tax=Ziziphus jujuba TaxID=326968 RepID=A0A6P3Z5N8_ZIZJJ|nr:LOW QUALITY PROTEIN: cytochrome P450 CYP82D47 [Ziziphus jujuba]